MVIDESPSYDHFVDVSKEGALCSTTNDIATILAIVFVSKEQAVS